MSKKYKAPFPIVKIWWVDSKLTHGWGDARDYERPEPSQCVTAGFLIADTACAMVVAANVNDGDDNGPHASSVIEIPRGCIRGWKQLG